MSKITKWDDVQPLDIDIGYFDEDLIEVKQAISKTLEKVFAYVFNKKNLEIYFSHYEVKDPLNFCVLLERENVKVDFNLEEEILYAKRLVSAYEDSMSQGIGTIDFEGKMVDLPLLKRAQSLLSARR